jgi:hypothetical protein
VVVVVVEEEEGRLEEQDVGMVTKSSLASAPSLFVRAAGF